MEEHKQGRQFDARAALARMGPAVVLKIRPAVSSLEKFSLKAG